MKKKTFKMTKPKIIRKIKPKTIKINMSYRDEECRACHKIFRAGQATSGFTQLILIGYHSVMDRKELFVCNDCTDIIYRLIGEVPTIDLYTAPSKYYTIKSLDSKNPRASSMSINGEYLKYNAKQLYEAVAKYEKKMKRKYPWSNVDYFKVAGVKRLK